MDNSIGRNRGGFATSYGEIKISIVCSLTDLLVKEDAKEPKIGFQNENLDTSPPSPIKRHFLNNIM